MIIFDTLYWREPLWLSLLALPLLIVPLYRLRQKARWAKLADRDLLPWLESISTPTSRMPVRLMLLLAWGLFILALSGPRTPRYIPPEVSPAKEKIIFIADLSASMNARDARTNLTSTARSLATQQLATNWSKALTKQVQTGIVIFAGNAHWLLKPSNDADLVLHYFDQLSQIIPPTLGNELTGAIRLAGEDIISSHQRGHIVILSDGDIDTDHRVDAEKTVAEIRQRYSEIDFTIVGIGGSEEIKVLDWIDQPLLINQRATTTRLDSKWLKRLASIANGQYLPLENAANLSLTDAINLRTPTIHPEDRTKVLWREWFSVPLILGILLLLAALELAKGGSKRDG